MTSVDKVDDKSSSVCKSQHESFTAVGSSDTVQRRTNTLSSRHIYLDSKLLIYCSRLAPNTRPLIPIIENVKAWWTLQICHNGKANNSSNTNVRLGWKWKGQNIKTRLLSTFNLGFDLDLQSWVSNREPKDFFSCLLMGEVEAALIVAEAYYPMKANIWSNMFS